MERHKISLVAAILSSMNIMIGSGVLVGPGVMAAEAGNAAFITWLIVALLFLPIVLSTVQMARMNPGPGGFYNYAKAGLNGTAGFWSGLLYVVGYTFAVAVELLALRQTLFEALGTNWQWFTGHPLLFNSVLIVILMGLNMLGLKYFSQLLSSLTIWKIIPLVTLILLLPFIIDPSFTITGGEVMRLPYSLPMAIFGFFGFEYACSISHQIENSERNAPLAILLGFTGTALLYTLFTYGVLNLMGPVELAEQGAALFADFITLPVPYLRTLLRIIIPTASGLTLFAAALGLVNGNATQLHSMAVKNLFQTSDLFKKESAAHRPWVTIIVVGLASFALAMVVPDLETVGNLTNIGVFLSFVLPLTSLLILQKQQGKHAYIPLTMVSLVFVGGLVVYSVYNLGDTMMARLYASAPLFALVGAGALMYRAQEDVPSNPA